MPWRIQLFGQISARRGDRTEDRFATKKNAELLGYLAMSPGCAFNRKHLCNILWPDAEDVDAARVRLRQAITSIRRQLEPPGVEAGSVVVTERDTVWLNQEQVESDVSEFEATLTLLRGCPPEKLKRHLNRIVELHGGEFMSGITAEWVTTEQERFHEKFIQAADQLVDLSFEEGDWQSAVLALKQTLAIDLYDEARYCKLMAAYRYLGRLSEAISLYNELATRLRRDLNVEPSPETSRLVASLRAEMDSGARRPTKRQAGSVSVQRHAKARRFPVPSTRFYGREKELPDVIRMINDPGTRLITLEGPGGVGKTRLALEVAEKLFKARSGSVWFVTLADLTNANEISAAVLSSIGVEPVRGAAAADLAVSRLAEFDDAVLIFDNFEHLIDEGASFVRELLDRLPNLCCLITSRQPLELAGEQEYRIGLLEVPPKGATSTEDISVYSSVQLFVDRAKLAKADFQLTSGNSEAISDLCRKLEGIPLAIEICAALIQTTTPSHMLAEVSKRFELLVSRRRDIPARHRSMRAAVEYSYRMLPPDLAYIFRQLAIFKGGWSLEAAQEILQTPNISDALFELQNRSFVTCDEILVSGQATMRFRMLETFRDFAWEMLSSLEQESISNVHEAYFSEFAKRQRAMYFNNEANADEVEVEQGNLYGAARWCLADNRLTDAMQLCFNLYQLWAVKSHYEEGIEWLESLLERDEVGTVSLDLQCACARALAHLTANRKRPKDAAQSLDLYASLAQKTGSASDVAHALSLRGGYFSDLGETEKAISLCEEAVAQTRSIGESSQTGSALTSLVQVLIDGGRYSEAIDLTPEAYSMAVHTGFQMNAGELLWGWAESLAGLGRYEESIIKLREATMAAEDVGSPQRIFLTQLGMVASLCLLDRIEDAKRSLVTALKSWEINMSPESSRISLQLAAYLASKIGRRKEAIELQSAAETIVSLPRPSSRSPLFNALKCDMEKCRSTVGSEFEEHVRRGQNLNQRQALDLAKATLALELDHAEVVTHIA
ncbi:MAG TPA: BTAD domain-containing putative transcriptional regulator [Fimbriimonadaceae bacterium]|jgi:predicted ATPase/DNA-binding SARP family transcriptional activator